MRTKYGRDDSNNMIYLMLIDPQNGPNFFRFGSDFAQLNQPDWFLCLIICFERFIFQTEPIKSVRKGPVWLKP